LKLLFDENLSHRLVELLSDEIRGLSTFANSG
jgi:predicted nuclease of predicted toxin-antitoxin system